MKLLSDLTAATGDDPLVLGLALLVAWVPICAIGLGLLVVLSRLQVHVARRMKARPAVVLPPAEIRPLATRRYATEGARSSVMIGTARVTMAVIAVAGFSAIVLLSSGSMLQALLAR